MLAVQEDLMKAVRLLSKVTGVEPGQKDLEPDAGVGFDRIEIKKAFDDIKLYMDLDESLVIPTIILRAVYDKYMDESCVNLRTLVHHARKGDLIFRFAQNVTLDRLMNEGVLHRHYLKAVRNIKRSLREAGADKQTLDKVNDSSWVRSYVTENRQLQEAQ